MTPKPYNEIPRVFEGPAPGGQGVPNPFEIHGTIRKVYGDIYKMVFNCSDPDETLDYVFLLDQAEANRILRNDENCWIKGPTTYEPFRSLVPKHIIAMEYDVHKRLRRAAQMALNSQIDERIKEIARKHVRRMEAVHIRPAASGSSPISKIDKIVRATALDIISESVFGEAWNAINDYTEANVKAYSLSQLMTQLHWRVTDFTKRSWRENGREEPVNSLLIPLETYIYAKIEQKRESNSNSDEDLLSYWINYSPSLSDNEIFNLCMTFLTMGHENIATAISWTIITLAENQSDQDEVINEINNKSEESLTGIVTKDFPRLVAAFYEANRLFPSVPSLTRKATKDTVICGYTIPQGTEILIPLYSCHRDENVWGEDSSSFKPSRLRDPSACPYFSTKGFPDASSFGVGERACLGRPLSFVEMEAIMTFLLKNYRIISKSQDKTEPNNFVSLRPGDHQLLFIPVNKSKM